MASQASRRRGVGRPRGRRRRSRWNNSYYGNSSNNSYSINSSNNSYPSNSSNNSYSINSSNNSYSVNSSNNSYSINTDLVAAAEGQLRATRGHVASEI